MARRRRRRKRKENRFLPGMKKKLMVVFIIIIGLLAVLIGRLIYIEFKSGENYEKIVLSQQESSSTVIPYRRGDIVDTNGTVLATSTAVYNVILDCSVLTSSDAYLEPTLSALSECFPELDIEEIRSYISENPDNQYHVIAEEISADEVETFEALQEDTENHPNINGIWFEKEYIRTYPYPELASSVIGFTTSGNEGMCGLEDYYNDELNGLDGREYSYLNEDSNYETTVKEAEDGNTIVTTIDANIQAIVQDKIQDFAEQYSSNESQTDAAEHIGVIAMDPDSGEILAMANYPTFSLDDAWDLTDYYTTTELESMSEDDELDALNSIWQNFCVTYTYEPGSTAKTLTVAAGLDSGKVSGSETYYCEGSLQVDDRLIRCDNRSGHGTETVAGALRDSCNVSLMQMVSSIGASTFYKYSQTFNLGLKTNIDLPGEARTDSLVYSEDELSKVNLATSSFGQGYNVTMIQMVCAYSSIVNGGYYYQPHMVKKILDEDGNTVETIDSTLLRRTISESTSETMIEYLQEVIEEGTGTYGKVSGYTQCGKTGTAEKLPRGEGNYVVSFITSVPAEDPEIVLYVVIDEPNVSDQAHSRYAQKLAKKILKEVLPYMNIAKDEE